MRHCPPVPERKERVLPATEVAEVVRQGCEQIVLSSDAFRLPGSQGRIHQVGEGLLLEAVGTDAGAWFIALERFADVLCMKDARLQPPMTPSTAPLE